MKNIEYEKKEKVVHYCINWGNDCAASEKEYSKVSRPRKKCRFCLQREANERNRKKQLEKYKENQDELLRLSGIEENQKKFNDTPVRLGKMFSETELERERLRIQRKEARQGERKKKPVKRIKTPKYSESEDKQKEYKVLRRYWEMKSDEMGGCYCEESGKYIPEFHIGNVHHILTKGSNKAAAYDLENLCILTAEMHTLAHSAQHKMKLHEYFEEVKVKMKRRYSQFGDLNILESKNRVA